MLTSIKKSSEPVVLHLMILKLAVILSGILRNYLFPYIWDFFKDFRKIITKIHKIGKKYRHFWIGNRAVQGCKNGQIKSRTWHVQSEQFKKRIFFGETRKEQTRK